MGRRYDSDGTARRHLRRHVIPGTAAILAGLVLVIGDKAANPDAASAHARCSDFFKKSAHTRFAQWYHCHDFQIGEMITAGTWTQARVHICGNSGTLHGITVRRSEPEKSDAYSLRRNGVHDPGGEGCEPKR